MILDRNISQKTSDLRGAFDVFDVGLAGKRVHWDTVYFDTHVSSSFIEGCMSRRRNNPVGERVS